MLLSLTVWSGAARAQVITVAGTSYVISFFPAGQSFDDNSATIIQSAWWGSLADATAFRSAYLAQAGAGAFDLTGDFDQLIFAYQPNPPDRVDILILQDDGAQSSLSTLTDSGTSGLVNRYYAYSTPTPVPEIDGNAMAKALFILFTLYVWIQVRRNRRAMG